MCTSLTLMVSRNSITQTVENSSCDLAHSDSCNTNISFDIHYITTSDIYTECNVIIMYDIQLLAAK